VNLDFAAAGAALHDMALRAAERAPYVAIALVVFALFYFAGRLVKRLLVAFAERTHRRHNLGLVLGRLGHAATAFFGLLVAMVIALPGFTPGQLVSVLGISSVAVGFAFRDILQNFLAGILLLLAEPFRIGDQVRTGEYEGTVEDIQTRATMIRTYDGRRIVIPNATLFVNPVTVNTAFTKRRLEHDFPFKIGEDVERAKALLLGALRGVADVLREPAADAVVVDFTDTSLKIRLRWWIEPPSQYELRNGLDAVLANVNERLRHERERLAAAGQSGHADASREARQVDTVRARSDDL
jgi:small conductance mechanosensitive channel